MSSLFGSQDNTTQISADSKDPAWFQNTSKRVIPNHLTPKKRLAFQLSASSNNKKDTKPRTHASSNSKTFNSTDFNLISFGNTARRTSNAGHADTSAIFSPDAADISQSFDNDDIPMYNEGDDLPPARSLYDLNDEVMISLNKPAQKTESFINKDPKSFANAFFQKSDISKPAEEINADKPSPLLHSESAILVFGYPEAMASQIIAYFSEFGTILEQFEGSHSKNASTNFMQSIKTTGAFHTEPEVETQTATPLPIFSGNSWIKFTYDNPSSAYDALQESGNVFNGVLIGVVPYTKDAIEKLQRRKLTDSEDVGGFSVFPKKETHEVDQGIIGDSKDLQTSYIKRLDVKDGTDMFLKANGNRNGQGQGEKKDENKLGLLASVSKYFFGFHDL